MSTLRNAVLALIAIQLTGCAVAVRPVYGPDGEEALALSCSGSDMEWSDCFEKAGELCGTHGYKVWNQVGSQSSIISGTKEAVFGSASEERTLLIACK